MKKVFAIMAQAAPIRGTGSTGRTGRTGRTAFPAPERHGAGTPRGARKTMDFVLVREDYEHAKPHPEPYLTGLKRFGATREEALVVEDSLRGLRSAVAAGIDCAIVHNDFTHSPDFAQARYRIKALIELRDIVVGET